MNSKKTTVTSAAAAVLAVCMAAALAGCSASDNSSSSADSKADVSSVASAAESDNEVKLYSDDSGVYYTQDGSKYYVNATQEVVKEDPITGSYDKDGISFDIPDGWYVDTNYGMPVVFPEGDGENSSKYLYVTTPDSLVGTAYDDITLDSMKEFFQQYIDNGYFASVDVQEAEVGSISSYETKAYKVKALKSSSDSSAADESSAEYDGSEDFYLEYVFINSDVPQAIYVNSANVDADIEAIDSVFETVISNMKITLTADSSEADSQADASSAADDTSDTQSAE